MPALRLQLWPRRSGTMQLPPWQGPANLPSSAWKFLDIVVIRGIFPASVPARRCDGRQHPGSRSNHEARPQGGKWIQRMNSVSIAVVSAASLVVSADAGFTGFVAYAKQVGANVFVDVFCAVSNSSDKFLNTFNVNSSSTYVQGTGYYTKTWRPDPNFSLTRSSVDSYMTAGCYSGAVYAGEYWASINTDGDSNWTGASWRGTIAEPGVPASPPATRIPANVGWYTTDPTSFDNDAMDLATNNVGYTRFDSVATAGQGAVGGTAGSAGANFGIWCAHLVIASGSMPTNINTFLGGWIGAASITDGVTGVVSQGYSSFIPAPGAIALVGVAGFAPRRRRS